MSAHLTRAALLIVMATLLAGCGGGGGGDATYTVTYNGNGPTSGSVPVDGNHYTSGQSVTVLGNTNDLTKSGFTYGGWNTLADGTGTTYTQGQTFHIGSGNVTLYAKWTLNPTYTVTYYGNDNTDGTVPVDNTHYETGQNVTVLGNTGPLLRTDYTFDGWNTQANGGGTSRAVGSTFTMGTQNVSLHAQWISTATCSDGVQNGGETGIDCGGSCAECTCTATADCGTAPTCKRWTCVAGACVAGNETDGTACDDNDACTMNDVCSGGSCGSALPTDCDDGIPCTTDICDVTSGCAHSPQDSLCDDYDPCTGTETCDAVAGCMLGVPLDCDDSIGCTTDACMPGAGCVSIPNDIICNDSNACTTNACDPVSGCTYTPVPDDTECGSGLTCQAGTCQ